VPVARRLGANAPAGRAQPLRRSDKGFGGIASALLLAVAVGVLLTGCGTLSGLLKSDGAGTLSATSETTPSTGASPVTTEESAASAPVAKVAPPDRGAADLDASPTALTKSPEPEVAVLTRRGDDEDESGSALAQDKSTDPDQLEEDYDPWEGFNEKMFSFNRGLDKYLLKPVARAYRFVMPEPWQVLIANGFDNINFVPRMVNSLLQAKWGGAGREIGRFLINSTAGIGGLFDPAKDYWGIQKSREDFGQTLCVWGAGAGPYLVLPFMEPLTVRDGIGKAVDGAMDPLSYVLPFFWDRFGMKVGDTINDRALNYDLFQGFEESVIDMYSAVRHGFLQRRAQLCKE
jgi:phospholipid-binding lipoprotein MlaA